MKHHSKRDDPGDFFWACFDCSVFSDSDKFGKVKMKGEELD
jgi:hypothetical protein